MSIPKTSAWTVIQNTHAVLLADTRVYDPPFALSPLDTADAGKHKLCNGVDTYAVLPFIEDVTGGGGPPTGAAGGALNGTYPNPVLAAVAGRTLIGNAGTMGSTPIAITGAAVSPGDPATLPKLTSTGIAWATLDAVDMGAVLEDTITDGEITKAPTSNAVFDALALKADIAALPKSYIVYFAGTDPGGDGTITPVSEYTELAGTITVAYASTGVYTLTSNGTPFTNLKRYVSVAINDLVSLMPSSVFASTSVVNVSVFDKNGSPSDAAFLSVHVTITP